MYKVWREGWDGTHLQLFESEC